MDRLGDNVNYMLDDRFKPSQKLIGELSPIFSTRPKNRLKIDMFVSR